MKRSAFTMIELVFVIVVLGILASIAIPKLTA
ncbi:MAG: prepilin-type N-terminal cleavage/methylation domain-containing protein, partial [Campylobacteraceae bacterium]|nr:prepilin-type N-terminal cleavage/methylation domain-containing protein [Campylobacteraceae bacterium]